MGERPLQRRDRSTHLVDPRIVGIPRAPLLKERKAGSWVVSLPQDRPVGQSHHKGGSGSMVFEPYPPATPLSLSFLLCTMETTTPGSRRILAGSAHAEGLAHRK